MSNNTRPPIGVMPMKLWREQRQVDLKEAIVRYTLADMPVPKDWIAELQTVNSWLQPEPEIEIKGDPAQDKLHNIEAYLKRKIIGLTRYEYGQLSPWGQGRLDAYKDALSQIGFIDRVLDETPPERNDAGDIYSNVPEKHR